MATASMMRDERGAARPGVIVADQAARPLQLAMPQSGEHFLMQTSARAGDGRYRFRWTLAVGKRGPPPHMHVYETESFAVVSGTLRIWVRGVQHDLAPGDTLSIPPGVPHRFLNAGGEPVVVDVSLDGTLQEDTFVPLAVMQSGGAVLPMRLFLASVVQQFANGVIGAHPPPVQWFVRRLARLLVALGVRGPPPVVGWDARRG